MLRKLYRRLYFARPLNRLAIRLYSLIRPLPWQRPNMEFEFDVWNGISTLHARSGRQIGENNTGPEMYREHFATEHRESNFDGSRQGLLVNMTALRHVLTVWRDTLQYATLLRARHSERRGLKDTRFNLLQGYLYSKIAAAAVAFLVRRRRQPLRDHSLAELETAFFTLGVGPFMVVRSLMERGDLAPLQPGPLAADEIYRLADSSGSLVTPTGKACAGSRKLITEFLDVTMNGSYRGPMDSEEAQRAFAALDDWDAFDVYLHASTRLELYVKIGRALLARNAFALRSGATALAMREEAALDDVLRDSYYRAPGIEADDIGVLERSLQVMFALLSEAGGGDLRSLLEERDLYGATAPTQRARAAQQIAGVIELLLPRCQDELRQIHRSLELAPTATIELGELYTRCGGPALQGLVRSLATAAQPLRLRIRPFELERDLPTVQRWVAMDYAHFWGLQDAGNEKIARIYTEQLARPGYETWIGEDADSGEPAFLLEVYDTRQDMLAGYYAAEDGDRGAHFMMAPAQTKRRGYTVEMLQACHRHMFANPNVRRIVGEPDARNFAIVRRLLQIGHAPGPFVQLPGKVARLMVLTRAAFEKRVREDVPRAAPLRLHRAGTALHFFLRRVRYKLREILGRRG